MGYPMWHGLKSPEDKGISADLSSPEPIPFSHIQSWTASYDSDIHKHIHHDSNKLKNLKVAKWRMEDEGLWRI